MNELTTEQIKLLEQNKIIPTGCPVEQVNFFNEVCKRKKLDPFTRQIHLVERKSKDTFGKWVNSYTIQAGIDGMRAIAQRNAKIISYKRWVEKREDGLYGICEITTEDRGTYKDELPFDEYAQKKSDGSLNSFWAKFPQTMIKKCAEESVLRMMVPEDLSGVYGDDEMMQADAEPKEAKQLQTVEVALIEPPKRNYAEETKDIKTKEEYIAWLETVKDEQSQKDTYQLRQDIQFRLTALNIEKTIAGIKSNTPDKTLNTIDLIIDSEKDITRKEELIKMYNERLEKVGHEYRYEKLAWEDK